MYVRWRRGTNLELGPTSDCREMSTETQKGERHTPVKF